MDRPAPGRDPGHDRADRGVRRFVSVADTGVAQAAFPNQANGSLVTVNGRVAGSSLLCQEFVDAKGNPLPQSRVLGFLGEPQVNVLLLNIALDMPRGQQLPKLYVTQG